MKNLLALVVSCNNLKTVVAKITHERLHPKYKKVIKMSKKVYAHCEQDVSVGEAVLLKECRPLSRTKRFFASPLLKKS